MITFLKTIVDTIGVLITFVINSVTSLINLLIHIPTYSTIVLQSINILPNFLIPFAIGYVSLMIVYFVLNRSN